MITTYIAQSSQEERAALLTWANELVALRDLELPVLEKTIRAIRITTESGTVIPFIKFLGTEIRRIGWDERELTGRLTLASAAVAALTFGGQGAGIAALGGAIGVPLWIIFGAGGALAGTIIEAIKKTDSKEK